MSNNKATLSGSISVFGDIEMTGSLIGTASWALNAVSASHALLADGLNATSLTLADLIVTNTASIEYLNVIYQSSSVIYSSGSNIFGDSPSDTQTLHGQVNIIDNVHISGTLEVDGGISGNLTGSLQGNASTATSSSHALNSDYAQGALSASYSNASDAAQTAISASHSVNADVAISASHALAADAAISASWAPTNPSTVFFSNNGISFTSTSFADGKVSTSTLNPSNGIESYVVMNNGDMGGLLVESVKNDGVVDTYTNLQVNTGGIISSVLDNSTGQGSEIALLQSLVRLNGNNKIELHVNDSAGIVEVTGSLRASSITGSLFGTASWSDNAVSASHALLADGLNATSLTLADLIITNTASIEYLNVVYQSSSVIYSSGSNIFGDASDDTQTLHGQVEILNDGHIYGTLQVDGGISGNITGSLQGNADTATSASYSSFAGLAYTATSASFATYANTATSALTASYFLTSSVTSASYALTASYALSVADVVFNREWHVSSGSGNDTTGNGSLSKPYQTLTKALTVAGGTGELIVVHPGTYRESVTINQANITIQGPQNAGGISYVSGSITVATANSNASVRMVGLMANNIIHNNVSRMYVRDVVIQNSIVKSGNATYVEFDNVNCQAAGGISVTGAGTVIFEGNNIALVTVNNASAAVFVKGALSCTGVTVTAGTFVADNSIVYPLASGSAAITSAVGSVVYLYNTNITTTTGLPERISIGGFLGYDDALFNKGLSTLGTSLNLKANFQSLDVNNITATGSLLGNASTATSASFATVANGLNPGSSISAVNITGSGNLQISGKVNFLNLGNYADDTIAAANGVAVGDLYRNGNFVVIRVS